MDNLSLDEQYRNERQPDKKTRYGNWTTAKGLQAVDGLETSPYLDSVAKDHIEGRYDSYRAKELIDSYYQTKADREEIEQYAEADMVAARINILIGEKAFTLSTEELLSIHERLFKGVFEFAGQIRKINIEKAEWVLAGDTVIYGDAFNLKVSLDEAMKKERFTPFGSMDEEEQIAHLASFCSHIWQLHPFREGNTRTVAVFMIKYLRKLGFEVDNTLFQNHSRYFRDALVRANYSSIRRGVYEDGFFLEDFFSDLLVGTKHTFRSRDLLVGPDGTVLKLREETLDDAICIAIGETPSVTRKQLAENLGVSEKTIERHLRQLGYVHSGSKKRGFWERTEKLLSGE